MKRIFILCFTFLGLLKGFAQTPGDLDTTFNSIDIGFGNGDGANLPINSIALQPDGKVLIGGTFYTYNGTTRNYIARLNADGSLDASFNPGSGASFFISSIALQPDGKILIGGTFTTYNGTSRNSIARLNADGSLDASFNPGTGASTDVVSIVLQPDGKVLIGGYFTSYNGTSRNRVARLNADGSLDASFNPGSGANNRVETIALQPDGKVLIGGWFTSYNGTTRNRIARLNADGSLDASFNPGTGASSTVESIALQPDGKVLIGGEFTTYNGTSRKRIARLNADGSLDASFNPGTGANSNSGVSSIALQPDGKVLIGGWFTSYNGTSRNRIARLNADGSLDASFNPGTGASGVSYGGTTIELVSSIALQPDGKILIGGNFTSYNGIGRNYIARLNADGSLDASFNPGVGANGEVETIALQPDGKVLIGGRFTFFNDTSRNRIARLNADGSLDASFNPGVGASQIVESIALQPDGKVLIVGQFTSYNGTSRNRIARLNADGSLDASFNPGVGASSIVESIALQPDGKVLIGGQFNSYNGTSRNRIARLNADGSLDASFNPGTGIQTVFSIALQPDGKVLIGGWFTYYNGTSRNRVARLNADGSLDASFNPGTGADSGVSSIALQPDGKVLIGGDFTSYNGTSRNRIARLNADGSLDASFNPGTGANTNSGVSSIALQPDGKVLIGGWFTSYNGTSRNHIARLNADGSLDASFNPGTGASITVVSSTVSSIALQPDGKVLIGGLFTSYNGIGRNRIARVHGASTSLPLLSTDSIASIGQQLAFAFASISNDGGAPVVSRGFCYNTTGNPTLADSTVQVGSGVGSYSASLSGLQPNTSYYVRAFATNSVGTTYGNELSFTTAGLGLNSLNKPKIRVYPNPTTNVVHVECPMGSCIKLRDLQGRLLKEVTTQSPVVSLNLNAYSRGSYVLEIDNQGKHYHQKVVKQ